MATSSDNTNYYHVTDNGDGAMMTASGEYWAFNGITPTATSSDITSSIATDASSSALVNEIRARLVAKGIFNS